MKQILTKDNSITFYNQESKELLHPESGAMKSINQKYLNHVSLKDNIKVLDIGYGIGYTSLAILNKINANITALEYNKEYIETSLKLHPKLKTVNILQGDARTNIKKLKIKFDLIILDAFSTMKNPELYSTHFFKELKNKMHKDSTLITYNSSPIIRSGLIRAGFKLKKYEISKYEQGTIANFKEENLTEEDKKLIRAFGIPFQDPNLNSTKEEILSIQNSSKEVNLV